MKYLLDTNICADLINNPNGKAAKRLFHKGVQHVGINWVVAAELRFGARHKASMTLQQKVDALLNELETLSIIEPALIEHYVDIRHTLTKEGKLIGANDLWIAAHARSMGVSVVTHNLAEFTRVPDLTVEDWLS